MYPSKSKNKVTQFQVFIDKNFLIFCINDKIDQFTIKHRYQLQFIEARIDKQDNKLVELRVKENREVLYLVCNFESHNFAVSFKDKLDELKLFIKENEIHHLLSYLEELTNL
jgi:hypothetical protein